jgi:hypothetical protein
MCHGRKGRVYHLLKRCEGSRREFNLGELTPPSRIRTDYLVDVVMLEEPLTIYFTSEGRKYVCIGSKIGNQYYVGQGFMYEGYWEFWEFVVEFDTTGFRLLADTSHTDERTMPKTDEDRGLAIALLLNPLDQYYLSQPPCSREVN